MRNNLAELAREQAHEFNPPVQSLMDLDFYKFTMAQVIHEYYPDVEVVFELIVRDKKVRIADIISEDDLRKSFDFVMGLKVRFTDLYYLRGIDLYDRYMFKEKFLKFLESFRLPSYELAQDGQGGYKLRFPGKWAEGTMWETIAVAIVSELYYRSLMKPLKAYELEQLYARALAKIYNKFVILQKHPHLMFADFGQRRRHSFMWQKYVVGLAKNMLGTQFTGTSNTWMAFHHDLPPIGTNAHELPMVITALADSEEEMRYAQYRVLELWQETYGQGLRIFLPDTYGSEQFFKNAPEWLASWRGQRQDSGNPLHEADRYIDWLKARGVNPKEKITIFSDGLDVDPMIGINDYIGGNHGQAFGWGTLLTNDFEGCHPTGDERFRPFSMVCKVVEANGRPTVKLSNNVNKATGRPDEIARYVKIFGGEDRLIQEVRV